VLGMDEATARANSIKAFVDWYINERWPENDDPIDDCMRLVKFAHAGGDRSQNLNEFVESLEAMEPGKRSIEALLNWTSDICFEFCPGIKKIDWLIMADLIISSRYGGTSVYMKSGKALNHEMVSRLSPKQIMEKYGVSRAYAYRLLKNK